LLQEDCLKKPGKNLGICTLRQQVIEAKDGRGESAMTMQELRWEMANICVSDHTKDGLKQGTLVQVLFRWEQDRFPGEPSLGKVTKIKVKSLLPPYVVKDIDGTDVA
jgi:hypothetical protein